MGSPQFGFPWTASSSPRSSLVTLEQATKKARICTNGCDEMSFAAAFKTTKNPNDFHTFLRPVNLAGEIISQVLSSLHPVPPTFHLRHSRLTRCHSPTQAFIPGNLVSWSAASRNLKKKVGITWYPPPKQIFFSVEPNSASSWAWAWQWFQ